MPDFLNSFNFDSGTAIWAALGIIIIVIALIILLKGVIKMLVLAAALTAAVGWWVLAQRMGFTYLEFITDRPQPWMVQVAAWGGSAFILLVYYHIRVWASELFSFRQRAGAGSIITTILMCLLMLWVAMIGISYYGDICRISYYHELALAQKAGKRAEEMPAKPWFTAMKEEMNRQPGMGFVLRFNPMENPAQTNLACLLAYGCTFDEPTYTAIYRQQLATRGIPQPTRFLDLFADQGLRTLVAEGRFVTLLENDRLTTFLQYKNTEELILHIL